MPARDRSMWLAAAVLVAVLVAVVPIEGLSRPGQFAIATMAFVRNI